MPKKKKYSFFKKCIDKRKIICYNNQASRGNILVYAAMAQLVEHILGKDEVPSSNLGSSSRQPRREIFGALAFYRVPTKYLWELFSLKGVVWSCYPELVPLLFVGSYYSVFKINCRMIYFAFLVKPIDKQYNFW